MASANSVAFPREVFGTFQVDVADQPLHQVWQWLQVNCFRVRSFNNEVETSQRAHFCQRPTVLRFAQLLQSYKRSKKREWPPELKEDGSKVILF